MTASSANAATITVCYDCNYVKINDAINNASVGDTIEVRSGTYYEDVIVNKQLILRGIDTEGGKPVIRGSMNAIKLNANGITLEGFKVTYCSNIGAGIYLEASDNNNIIENTVNCQYGDGIVLKSSNFNTFTGNTLSGNRVGFYLKSSSNNNNIINNVLRDNMGGGIFSKSSNSNIIKNNVVEINGYHGINIMQSSDNTIVDNIIAGNHGIGIYLDLYSNNNIVYQNKLSDNKDVNVYDDTTNNRWDNGIDKGNQYSDYDEPSEGCRDIDNNGICDLPYPLNTADHFPLASIKSTPMPTPSPPSPTPTLSPTQTLTPILTATPTPTPAPTQTPAPTVSQTSTPTPNITSQLKPAVKEAKEPLNAIEGLQDQQESRISSIINFILDWLKSIF